MINLDQRVYDYYTFGANDDYGQPQLSEQKSGTVSMAINLLSHRIEDSLLFADAEYMGLTYDATIDDKCVIDYGGEMLKVIYISPFGRFRQAFMKRMG